MKRTIFLMLCVAFVAHAKEWHVSIDGFDSDSGTKALPLRTIQRAADLAQPGDVVTVHEGIYRERVNPPRGGNSDAERIVYQAAPGEMVAIKGSELATNWENVEGTVWKAVLPNTLFGDFNPFDVLLGGNWFDAKGRSHHAGEVYLNGDWLPEAASKSEVFEGGTSAVSGYLFNVTWMKALGAGASVPASDLTSQQGIQLSPAGDGGDCLAFIEDGDWATFDIDFGSNSEQMEFRISSKLNGGMIEIRLGSAQGTLLGTCNVPVTGNWASWQTVQAQIDPVSGEKSICFVFKAPVGENADMQWFAEVNSTNTEVFVQFDGVNPNTELVEVNARQSVFYPELPSINYITVRGFVLEQAASPWAPPTDEQIGLIGTHWSKGWVIENNEIRYSKCVGITLGKYGDEFADDPPNADTYNQTIERALTNNWGKAHVGSHLVSGNHISYCGQAGVVGSLGAVFSTIRRNEIHEIHTDALFGGVEMAGIKIHAPIDCIIEGNHIYRCVGYGGVWLDWMTQGTRMTGNLMHENSRDLFVEVNHGPFLVDNNIFLSANNLWESSGGGAYVHNLFGGGITLRKEGSRTTPYHVPHSTAVAGRSRVTNDDVQYRNNLFAGGVGLSIYNGWSPQNLKTAGNVYLSGASPAAVEQDELVAGSFDPEWSLEKTGSDWHFEINVDPAWNPAQNRSVVTTTALGKAIVPDVGFEQPDGQSYYLDAGFFGKGRALDNPAAGPFAVQAGDTNAVNPYLLQLVVAGELSTETYSDASAASGVPSVENAGATQSGSSQMELKGTLFATTTTEIEVVWDVADRGTNLLAWAGRGSVDSRISGNFSVQAAPLMPGSAYVFRCMASNEYGVAWSDASPFALPHGYARLEDFESYLRGSDIGGQNAWVGNAGSGAFVVQADPDNANNQVLHFDEGGDDFVSLNHTDLRIDEGATSTVFFRTRGQCQYPADPDKLLWTRVSMSDVASARELTDGETDATIMDDGSGNLALFSGSAGIVDQQKWHKAWLVIDNAADTFDAYIQPEGGVPVQVLDAKPFRNGAAANALVSLMFGVYGNNGNGSKGAAWFDDIYIVHGADMHAYSPVGSDRDLDGLADVWELDQFGSYADSDGTEDADADGFCDLHEFRAGTSAVDQNSLLEITSVESVSGNNDLVIKWKAVVGKSYAIMTADDISNPDWEPVAEGIRGVDPLCTHTAGTSRVRAFYRIELE